MSGIIMPDDFDLACWRGVNETIYQELMSLDGVHDVVDYLPFQNNITVIVSVRSNKTMLDSITSVLDSMTGHNRELWSVEFR